MDTLWNRAMKLMAKLIGKDWREEQGNEGTWERFHIAQAYARPQPWRKSKYIIYHFLLEMGAQGFLPCSTLTLFEV